MTCLRFAPRVLPWWLALLTASACGDDGSTDSTTAAATTSGSTGSASTGDPATEGSSGSPTSDSGQVATETSATTSVDDTSGTTGATCEETVGPEDGTMVGSCKECSAEQLCMELTEHGGPADGGGPMVQLFCFPIPVCCDAEIDCDCAGHLCPEKVVGGAASCQTTGGVLECDLAFP